MSKTKLLWQSIKLPKWNPKELYEAFITIRDGIQTVKDEDTYAKQLMILISAFLGREKWMRSLRDRRLDPEDVAVDVLMHVRAKTPTFNIEKPMVQVLLAFLNRTIYHQVIAAMRKQRVVPDSLPVTDWSGDEPQNFGYFPRREDDRIDKLRPFLKAAEDEACKGNWADQISICVLYRYLCRKLFSENTILSHSALPTRLRKRINATEHARISSRINRLIRDFASGA